MKQVAYNQALKNSDFYGYGIVQNRQISLDLPGMAMMKGGIPCEKRPITYPPNEKVNRNYTNNFENYLNQPIDSLNFEERADDRVNRGLTFAENNPNENYDFDGDGVPDLDLFNHSVINDPKSAEVAETLQETPEEDEEAEQQIEEKSTKVNEPEVVMKEPELKSVEQQLLKKETPQNELKDVTANATDKQISMSDGVIMGVGGLALAMMILGKT